MLIQKEEKMRLWHYKLIPFLPDSQLLAQWRELNSIFKNQPKHILINYVYQCPKEDLYLYSLEVLNELKRRNFHVKTMENAWNYFGSLNVNWDKQIFEGYHNDRYLLQCFMNLQEKFDRGQQDFSKVDFETMRDFVYKELKVNCLWLDEEL